MQSNWTQWHEYGHSHLNHWTNLYLPLRFLEIDRPIDVWWPKIIPSFSLIVLGGTPDHVKLIIGVTAGLFIVVMVILTVCLVCRNAKKSSKPNILIQDDELDTAV